jgi:hypothetical protein
MKYFLLLTAIAFVTLATVFAQSNNKNLVRDNKVVEEIKRLDRQWIIDPYGSRDMKDFDRIVAEDFLVTGSNGETLNKAQKRARVVADSAEAPSPGGIFKIEESSAHVRVFDKTAVSIGYIIEKYVYKGVTNDSRVYFTNTYLKRNRKWQLVASQFTRVNQSPKL